MASRRFSPFLISTALAAGLALGSGPLAAETLTDALITAYQTSPLLEANRAALRNLDENVPQARANRRPQVGASISGQTGTTVEELDFGVAGIEASLTATLLLFDNGQTAAAVEAARNQVASGRADLKDVEQLVLFNAVQAYVDVRRDEEFVRLAVNDVDRLDETLSATQNRFDVGEVTRTDVSQSEARLAESRSQLAAARGQLEISREAYRAAVGVAPGNLERLPKLPDLPATLEEATAIGVQRNPQVVAAQFNERAAVYNFDRALAAKGPTISVGGSVGVERLRQNPQLDYDGSTFGQASISANLPLYTGGRNDSLVRQAQAVLDQRRFLVQDVARQVTQQVAAAWAQLQVAQASIVARRQQAEASRIAAEGVAEEARLGARSTLEVLDAVQENLQAEAQIVQALRDEYVASYALMRAMGLLTVEHLRLGIESYNPDVYFSKVQSGPRGGYDTSAVDRIRQRWER
ncbi:MAG TPA: TolC family outer membrane protein [Amaricoccus sp.]|uniref:TolC family outer membrane protein n=1 Tax=Amaricoccus sp. TaxID=1872485 RepID=UPI001D8E6490|nr:TolC family outer membrane protein [Amaricoccus sp.]MCB1374914.1 TolC family outer membrane protein [Paracoccaceae bacterium]MCC0067124.1 TolC family outer membrane protein [Rhodovulum sp.]MCB1403446.1 TolC family outer membrane protein [Paracoccaceae bacterium]HPG23267.1 TolC family outer membrane protein [Amaricoccus sp.]HRW14674.1 TolC family outer membrane protein [Amaricoccus sp.]